ncbi:TadE family protein [Propioniciclava soli]|uniref:TadE family protein n=1 Tax=Propioniciclava soli TaxID=2775081 RepID=UPI001E339104|nr:TadE family protein [Propioniciclava soli]
MRRSRTSRWQMRGERGSSSVEMVIALPIVLTVLFLAVQAGSWFHARSIALASAQSGARTSAMLNSSLEAGLSSARSFAADVGGTTLTGVTVTGDRTATSTTVTVTGHSVRLVPFMDVTVSQSATLPVERYTR